MIAKQMTTNFTNRNFNLQSTHESLNVFVCGIVFIDKMDGREATSNRADQHKRRKQEKTQDVCQQIAFGCAKILITNIFQKCTLHSKNKIVLSNY